MESTQFRLVFEEFKFVLKNIYNTLKKLNYIFIL